QGGEPERHRAFDLRGDLVGIDRVPAIDRDHHAMDGELALLDRYLGNRRLIAAVTHVLRDTALHAGRQRLVVLGLLRPGVEHRQRPGKRSCERGAEGERVLAGRARHLVDEAFQIEHVLRGVDAATWADRHMGVAHRVLDPEVRYRIAQLIVARYVVE